MRPTKSVACQNRTDGSLTPRGPRLFGDARPVRFDESGREPVNSAVRLCRTLAAAAVNWWRDDCLLWGAALAFHALLSLAPLVFVVVFAFGMFLDDPVSRSGLVEAMERFGSPAATSMVEAIVGSMADSPRSTWGVVVSVGMAIVAGTAVFGQLQRTLNHIWRAGADADASWTDALIDRLLAAAMIAVFGLGVLISSAIAWTTAALERAAGDFLPGTQGWLANLDIVGSWAILALATACIFRWLPDARIAWRNVLVGGAATAGLFLIGKAAVAHYLRVASVGSAYGAAGSVVVFVAWVYYTSQAFLYGAECTAIWAGLRPIAPPDGKRS